MRCNEVIDLTQDEDDSGKDEDNSGASSNLRSIVGAKRKEVTVNNGGGGEKKKHKISEQTHTIQTHTIPSFYPSYTMSLCACDDSKKVLLDGRRIPVKKIKDNLPRFQFKKIDGDIRNVVVNANLNKIVLKNYNAKMKYPLECLVTGTLCGIPVNSYKTYVQCLVLQSAEKTCSKCCSNYVVMFQNVSMDDIKNLFLSLKSMKIQNVFLKVISYMLHRKSVCLYGGVYDQNNNFGTHYLSKEKGFGSNINHKNKVIHTGYYTKTGLLQGDGQLSTFFGEIFFAKFCGNRMFLWTDVIAAHILECQQILLLIGGIEIDQTRTKVIWSQPKKKRGFELKKNIFHQMLDIIAKRIRLTNNLSVKMLVVRMCLIPIYARKDKYRIHCYFLVANSLLLDVLDDDMNVLSYTVASQNLKFKNNCEVHGIPKKYVLCRYEVTENVTGGDVTGGDKAYLRIFFKMFSYFSRRDIFRKDKMVLDILDFMYKTSTIENSIDIGKQFRL